MTTTAPWLKQGVFFVSQVLNCMGIRRWNHLFDCTLRAEIFACTKEVEFFKDYSNGL